MPRSLRCIGAMAALLALHGCSLMTSGRFAGEWATDLAPIYACRGDTVTATWNDRIHCSAGLTGSGAFGTGAAAALRDLCPAYPLVTITLFPPERSLVARSSRTSGRASAVISETTTAIFDADPVVYSPGDDAGPAVALPRHRHQTRVIVPDRIESIEALSEGACEGARPAWLDVVIDITPLRVRSATVQALRVCNLGGQAANFALGARGASTTVRIEARSCLALDPALSAILETVTTTGAALPPTTMCGPSAGAPPAPIPFSVQLACPNVPG